MRNPFLRHIFSWELYFTMRRQGLDYKDLADLIEVPTSYVKKWIREEAMPGKKNRELIEYHTGMDCRKYETDAFLKKTEKLYSEGINTPEIAERHL